MPTLITSSIESKISDQGYTIIRYPDSKDIEEILDSLGDVIQTTEIRENPRSTRLLGSNQAMDFHTDHNAANYIAWHCNSQSATGGESLLIDTRQILAEFSKSTLSLLQEISVKTHKVFYGDKLSIPLLTPTEDEHDFAVYYASWLIGPQASIKHTKALDKFRQELAQAKPVELLLSEGDILIIDNHRMLHGRTGFPPNSNRWLTRYWLKRSDINIF
jgi:Taurine catabolism dioxygenase TauD, TfdA family